MSFSKAPPWSHQSDRRADSTSAVVPWGKYWGGSTSLTHRDASQRSSFPIPLSYHVSHAKMPPSPFSLSPLIPIRQENCSQLTCTGSVSLSPPPSDSIFILEPVASCHLPQKSCKPPCFPFTHTLNLSYKDPRTIRQRWQIFLDSKVRAGRRCLIMAETKLWVLVGPSATIYRSGSERIKYHFQSKLIKGFKPRSFANKW